MTVAKAKTDNWNTVREASVKALPEHIVACIDAYTSAPQSDSQLISVLHKVQDHFGYLGREQLDAVAQLMQIPAAKVAGVASFYHFFRLKPRGRFIIRMCLGTACYVKGADRVSEKLKDELGIDFGETTTDGLFSLEGTRCLGVCGLAPVLMVGDEVHGKVTADQIPALIESYIVKARNAYTAAD
jgi:NADH:ubiquinone oxidoreductase subunit E